MKRGLILTSILGLFLVMTAGSVLAGGYAYQPCEPEYPPVPSKPVQVQLIMPKTVAPTCYPKARCEEQKVTCYKTELEPVRVPQKIKVAVPLKKVVEYTCWMPVREKVQVTDYEKAGKVVPVVREKPMAMIDPNHPSDTLTCMKPVQDTEVVEDWKPVTEWQWLVCMKPVKCKKVCTVWRVEEKTVYQTYNKKKKVEVPCPTGCKPYACK